jgi:mannosylglycoprotein endo-beta-mannosidase
VSNGGDKNSTFFFRAVKNHHNRSKIVSVCREDGTRIDNPQEVKAEVVSYFKKLLNPDSPCGQLDINSLSRALPNKISPEQCETLGKEVSEEEVKTVLFSLKDNKAPGPDGYNATFFKRAWSIVGKDVTCAVKDFFSSGRLLKEVNATAIALIPKVPNPSKLKEFRPISCCNTIYKCIAKILANRIKPLLPHLVGEQQTAFVEGRRIRDNILLAQELLRNYHRNQGTPRCALKVDFMKAYDMVRWDFIFEGLHLMGFPDKVVHWIKECVTTSRFSISINGELNGFFPGGRGLRQGDPLSPYLFVLVMEAFSGLMNNMVEDGKFKWHWKCEKVRISHLCFADDLLIFCRGEVNTVSSVADCLKRFKDLSGLSPNPDKSNIFTSGVSSCVKEQLISILGYKDGVLPVRYLGVPLISSRLKATDCRALVERIVARARSWTNRALSYAGRLQLINSILFAIQVYWSAIFILPKAVIKQVEGILRAFLWSGSELNSKGAKIAWNQVCLPKKVVWV